MIIRTRAYPRAALIGNPSDGYFGKTIAFCFRNFHVDVELYESPELQLVPGPRDHDCFSSIRGLAEDVRMLGYYGGIRLLKASVKRFYDYCLEAGHGLHDRNFTLRYRSGIPHLVGLAGSSAIVTACFRALSRFYAVRIEPAVMANLILSVERDELGIAAGLQDRVAQVYQGLVCMDFDRAVMEETGCGVYEMLDPSLLPNLYIAYRVDLSEGSERVHNSLRMRYEKGDSNVLEAIGVWRDLTDRVKAALVSGRGCEIGRLMDENFDRRAAVMQISEGNRVMVEKARSVGASAKFTGSGGAIIGSFENEEMFEALSRAFALNKVEVIRPQVVPPAGEENNA